MKRIPSLDGFRAISILLVLFAHSRLAAVYPLFLNDLANLASVGVTVFFVISGFLITNLLLHERATNGAINVKAFYVRRIFRILPVYILYVVFILLWQNIEKIGLTPNNLWHVLTFTVNFDNNAAWFLGHFWTLSIEEQFYLFWPAILIVFSKHLKIVLCVLIIYSCFIRVIAYKFPGYEIFTLSPFFAFSDAIFIGALGGIIFFENPEITKHKIFHPLTQVLALLVFCMFRYFEGHGSVPFLQLPFGNSIISFSALFLILANLEPSQSLIFKFLNNKVMVHIGILSYSIYIWQQFFFVGEFKVFWRTFPVNIAVIYCVSLASWYLWERPFLRLQKTFLKPAFTINHLSSTRCQNAL